MVIIGGFLVSRLVSLSAERSGLQRRRTELERSLSRYKGEREILDIDSYIAVRDWFLKDTLSDYIEAEGAPDLDDLVRENEQVGSNPTMLREIAEWVGELVAGVIRLWRADAKAFIDRVEDMEWLEEQGLPVGEGMEGPVRQVAVAVAKSVQPQPMFASPYDIEFTPRDEAGEHQQEERLRRMSTVVGQIAAANVELEILDADLGRVGKPEGVQEAIVVLAGFAVVGIVVPLVMLALRPVPSVWWARLLVVIGFTAGLGAVVGQLLIAVRRLGRD